MTNAQIIIDTLFSGYVDLYELPDEAQSVLELLRNRVVSSPDARKDLQALYGARDCDDMAMGLLWVLERSEQDAERATPTGEEEQVVHTVLTTALTRMGYLQEPGEADEASRGDAPPEDEGGREGAAENEDMQVMGGSGGAGEGFETSPDTVESAEEAVPEQSQFGSVESSEDAFGGQDVAEVPSMDVSQDGTDEQPGGGMAQPLQEGEGTTDPAQISAMLEQLVEALQAGAEERDHFLVSLRSSFSACLADPATDASLLRYAEVVDDFLRYVQENDLLDDVRVMNFFTNVQEPFSQWVDAAEGEREGVLEQAIEFLVDFRAMFE